MKFNYAWIKKKVGGEGGRKQTLLKGLSMLDLSSSPDTGTAAAHYF